MADLVDNVIVTRAGRVSYAESGTGPPVRILLHSLLTDRTAFDSVALGGRVIALDLPGFGSTDPARADIDDYATRVAAFVAAAGLDPGEVTLIGNGLGAFVALGTAIRHPEALARLLLIGCGAGFPEEAKGAFAGMINAVETGGMEAVIPVALRRIFTEAYLEANPAMAAERSAVLMKTDPSSFVTACQALQALDYSVEASSVTVPTVIVVGEEDQATPPALAEELHRMIAGSDLVRLPGVAHAPQLQDPEGFINAIRQFLEEQ